VTDRLVCVGGPVDGKSYALLDQQQYLTVPVMRKLDGPPAMSGLPDPECLSMTRADYCRIRIEADGARGPEKIEFLIYIGMSPAAALRKLLEDHRP
jgi:hypothetical protein